MADRVNDRFMHLVDSPDHVRGVIINYSGEALIKERSVNVVPSGERLPA